MPTPNVLNTNSGTHESADQKMVNAPAEIVSNKQFPDETTRKRARVRKLGWRFAGYGFRNTQDAEDA